MIFIFSLLSLALLDSLSPTLQCQEEEEEANHQHPSTITTNQPPPPPPPTTTKPLQHQFNPNTINPKLMKIITNPT